MEKRLAHLGPLTRKEKLCMIILLLTVVLWVSEPIHHLHPSIPTILAVILMAMPGIGFAKWQKVVNINFDTVLILGVTLSMGFVFIDSGTAKFIGEWLNIPWFKGIFQQNIIAITFIVLFTQLFHKLISNVQTAVVTFVPIIITVSQYAGVNPQIYAFTTGLTSLYGFILSVETMPNLIVHSTGKLSQQDFFKPGLYATVVSMVVTIFIAATWWKFIGII